MARSEDLDRLVRGLREAGMRVAFAESCTGGRLAADLTTIPGSSDVVVGSAVCYQLGAKRKILGLSYVTEANVVSSGTVVDMAKAARDLFGADIGAATTGWLDGEHDGYGPHAYWAIVVPGSGGPVVAWDFVNFGSPSDRGANRQRLVDEVFRALSSFASSRRDRASRRGGS